MFFIYIFKHPDHYSCTKSLAEMSVLKANGCILNDGSILKTCALRLAGVYGPGEQRHLPRIVVSIYIWYLEKTFKLLFLNATNDFVRCVDILTGEVL